jgi:hypothetical protein
MNCIRLSDIPAARLTVTIKGRYVCIRSDWHLKHKNVGTYDIALRNIDTPVKLPRWLHYLSEKVWLKPKVTHDLITVVAGHFGWACTATTGRRNEPCPSPSTCAPAARISTSASTATSKICSTTSISGPGHFM